MWINQIPCYLLMVAHLCILNRFVYSQEKGSSYSAQNLTCITHNLDNVVCTWITDAEDDSELTYKFCYSVSSSIPQCSLTKEKKATFALIIFDHMQIEITTFNSTEEGKNPLAKNTFALPEKDILLVPLMPHIHRLTSDYIADTSILEWYDGGSVFQYQIDSSWQIQVLRKDPMEEIALEIYNTSIGSKDSLLRWEWTSDLPFNCTTHYFRIRCFLNEKNFAGRKMWSEWSPLVNISGRQTGKFPKMYPLDKVVAVGSNVTFCCVYQPGFTFKSINYASCKTLQCEVALLTQWSKTLFVPNVISGPNSDFNGWCEVQKEGALKDSVTGTVLFVGYPPGVPQNLTCETQNFKQIACHWEEERYTLLCGSRKTHYALYEGNSGKNISCAVPRCKYYHCNFTVLKDQTEYNFTLHASNHLGQTEASLLIDIRHRVYPHTPTDLRVSSVTSASSRMSFSLPGNFKETQLQCQVRISNGTSQEERNVLLNDSGNSRYTILVDKLHPFTKYHFQVRCATPKPFFWKWSDWSTKKTHTTQEAQPARALDIWREKDANEDTVTLFWKPLPLLESNGLIETYEIYWTLPDKSTKNESVPASRNSTKINLGKNDYIFTVKAKNKAGVSPPSSINSAELPVGDKPTPSALSPRMQRWAIFLAAYDYVLKHRPGKDVGNADGLSRCPLPEDPTITTTEEDLLTINLVDYAPVTSAQVARATDNDPTLKAVRGWVMNGWPTKPLGDGIKPFLLKQRELNVQDNCLLWGDRVVIPASLQRQVLATIHSGHPGMARMKGLARSYAWWPNMDKDIEDWVASCGNCQATRSNPPKSTPWEWERPLGPWRRVHIDLAGPINGLTLLIVVDAHSKWLEVRPMASTTAGAIIIALRQIFATHGLPELLVSDNGPQFTALEFENFLASLNVRHALTAPHHPQSNGQAERFVRTTKEALSRLGPGDLQKNLSTFLLSQHLLPCTATGKSPAELLMGRRLRGPLDSLKPADPASQQRGEGPPVRAFPLGAKVDARNYTTGSPWKPGTVTEVTGPKSYRITLEDGQVWRRHIDQLRRHTPPRDDNNPRQTIPQQEEEDQALTFGINTQGPISNPAASGHSPISPVAIGQPSIHLQPRAEEGRGEPRHTFDAPGPVRQAEAPPSKAGPSREELPSSTSSPADRRAKMVSRRPSRNRTRPYYLTDFICK